MVLKLLCPIIFCCHLERSRKIPICLSDLCARCLCGPWGEAFYAYSFKKGGDPSAPPPDSRANRAPALRMTTHDKQVEPHSPDSRGRLSPRDHWGCPIIFCCHLERSVGFRLRKPTRSRKIPICLSGLCARCLCGPWGEAFYAYSFKKGGDPSTPPPDSRANRAAALRMTEGMDPEAFRIRGRCELA